MCLSKKVNQFIKLERYEKRKLFFVFCQFYFSLQLKSLQETSRSISLWHLIAKKVGLLKFSSWKTILHHSNCSNYSFWFVVTIIILSNNLIDISMKFPIQLIINLHIVQMLDTVSFDSFVKAIYLCYFCVESVLKRKSKSDFFISMFCTKT